MIFYGITNIIQKDQYYQDFLVSHIIKYSDKGADYNYANFL